MDAIWTFENGSSMEEGAGSRAWKLFDPSTVHEEIGRCISDSNNLIVQNGSAVVKIIWCFCLGHRKTCVHDYVQISVTLVLTPIKGIHPEMNPKYHKLNAVHSLSSPGPPCQYERVGFARVCIDPPCSEKHP